MKLVIYLSLVAITAGTLPAPGQRGGSDWQTREREFRSRDVGTPIARTARDRLVSLLRAENQLLRDTLVSTGGHGVSAVYGEGYAEYYARLLSTVGGIAKSGDDEAMALVAAGGYNPHSAWAQMIADRWPITLPVFLAEQPETAGGSLYAGALEMMARILESHRAAVKPDQVETIESRILAGLGAGSPLVRSAAISATVRARLTKALPLLRKCAADDPSFDAQSDVQYPLRKAAAEAIAKLEKLQVR